MFNITIVAVGKIKEIYLREGILDYQKRIKPYGRLAMEELDGLSFRSDNREQVKKKEGEKIIKALEKHKGKFVVALHEWGREFTSVDFSKYLAARHEEIVFVIGGSLGFSKEVLDKVDAKISLSKMTFPHEVARLLLCEQLYRAITIDRGKTYHY